MGQQEKKELTVKYANELNQVAFHKLEQKEIDLFFYFCAKLKEKKGETVSFTFSDLKKVINFKARHKSRFVTVIDNISLKMSNFTIRDDSKLKRWFLFSNYEIDTVKETMEIKINPDLQYLLNSLISKRHTLFEIKEFIKIKSMYAKNCYRLLKQFRRTGYMKISVEEFRRILDVPQSYRMSSVNQKVLTPIKNELKIYFKGLNVKANKVKGKTAYFEFFFQKEKPENKEPNVEPKLLDDNAEMQCDKCNIGYLVEKLNKEDEISFLACDRFPQCKNTQKLNKKPQNVIIEDIKNLAEDSPKMSAKENKKGTMSKEEIKQILEDIDNY